MNQIYENIKALAEKDLPYIKELRREFHRHPEIGSEEHWTAARIEEELDKISLPHYRLAGTGIVARLKGEGSGEARLTEQGLPRCMALRADIDGLPLQEMNESPYKSEIPGHMHACGHDVHTASLIGAARILQQCRKDFCGDILFIFQPGEENGYGGRLMVEEGAVKGATRCFGFHIAPELKLGTLALIPGPNNACCDWFCFKLTGTASHAAYPHQGADALYAAAQIVVAAQSLVTRLNNPQEPLLLTFGKLEAGVAYNIVAEQAVLEGTLRSLNPAMRAVIHEKLEKLARDTAALYGCSVGFQWEVNGQMLVNTPESVEEAWAVASSLFGPTCLVDRKPALIGDDMSDFINAASGSYAFIGTQNPQRPETALPLHHVCLDVDEDIFTLSVPLSAAYALAYMRGEVQRI